MTNDDAAKIFDSQPEFQKLIEENVEELRRLAWQYKKRHGELKFLIGGQPIRIPQKLLNDAKVVESRNEIVKFLSKKGNFCEIGTWKGDFAKFLIERCDPKIINIVDLNFSRLDLEYFGVHINSGLVNLMEGDSSTRVSELSDDSQDMIYIDGDHSYSGIVKDIKTATKKVKRGGLIVFNDYTNWSAYQFEKYGTVHAVADFATEFNWPMEYLALEPNGYYDVAFRRPN